MVTRYFNGRLLRNHQLQQEDLWVSQGKIIAPQLKADEEIDAKGAIIAPGYIDLQINGGFGYDFSSEPESVEIVARLLPQYGVTAFLPTVISSSSDHYHNLIPHLYPRTSPGTTTILGCHLEGPFFCKKRSGAHNLDVLQSLDQADVEEFYGSLENVRIVTLAPEQPQAFEAIEQLKTHGVIVSAGHSSASYSVMQESIKAGVSLATHLFNAMAPLHHREPGLVTAILTSSDMHYSVIADGVHLHPAILKLCWQTNPKGLILVTDAIEALGLEDGSYRLGSKDVTVSEGKAVIAGTETIAGSVISMDAAVRYFQEATGCNLINAIEAATLKPATVLGIEKEKGTLDIGANADFIFLDDQLYVQACYIAGKLAKADLP